MIVAVVRFIDGVRDDDRERGDLPRRLAGVVGCRVWHIGRRVVGLRVVHHEREVLVEIGADIWHAVPGHVECAHDHPVRRAGGHGSTRRQENALHIVHVIKRSLRHRDRMRAGEHVALVKFSADRDFQLQVVDELDESVGITGRIGPSQRHAERPVVAGHQAIQFVTLAGAAEVRLLRQGIRRDQAGIQCARRALIAHDARHPVEHPLQIHHPHPLRDGRQRVERAGEQRVLRFQVPRRVQQIRFRQRGRGGQHSHFILNPPPQQLRGTGHGRRGETGAGTALV